MIAEQYLDALLSLPSLEFPKISKDGCWAAWTWYRTGPAADAYAAPTDGSSPPLRLTQTGDETILVAWTPDSRSVIISQDRDGDERAQLFRVPTKVLPEEGVRNRTGSPIISRLRSS